MTVLEALRAVEPRLGSVAAPHLRAIARGEDTDGRARAALAHHLEGAAADAARELTADEARGLLGALGYSLRGAPRKPAPRAEGRVTVYLTPDEQEELDRRRGETPASEWIARAAGLRA